MRPAYRVEINGTDISLALRPVLVSISVQDGSGTESDKMEIALADPKGTMDLPSKGATVSIWLGYERMDTASSGGMLGTAANVARNYGLTKMGDFVIDEVEVTNPPRKITARGNSIDLRATSRPKARRREHYEDETVLSLVAQLAYEMGYLPAVHPDLAGREVETFDRDAESPMSAVTRLARRFDAVATVKEGVLAVVPAGVGETVTGAPIPPIYLAETSCSRWRFGITDRQKYEAVEARYHDFHTAEDVWVRAGSDDDGSSTYQLRQTYPDRTAAQEAARAKLAALQRGAGNADITTIGYPVIGAQVPILLQDFGAGIDGRWIADEVEHRFDNSGYVTTVRAKLPAGGAV